MSDEEAALLLQQECPRRVLGELHLTGEYAHYVTPRFPGKVLCLCRGSTIPPSATPTWAQGELWRDFACASGALTSG